MALGQLGIPTCICQRKTRHSSPCTWWGTATTPRMRTLRCAVGCCHVLFTAQDLRSCPLYRPNTRRSRGHELSAKPKVRALHHPVFVQQQVGTLQVAVDDLRGAAMQVRHAPACMQPHSCGGIQVQRGASCRHDIEHRACGVVIVNTNRALHRRSRTHTQPAHTATHTHPLP